MSRLQTTQRQRTQDNPLFLGEFSQLSIRALKGSLGPENKLIGRSDTSLNSNGGFGGGTYNHWFSIRILKPAWIIVAKGGVKPKFINVSTYDLGLNPIQSRGIFQDDSITVDKDGSVYNPYVGHVMNAQSDLYNTFDPKRLDRDDERYFPLGVGTYLICISSVRNEPVDYDIAVVVEFTEGEFDLLLENYTLLLLEDSDGQSFFEADVTETYAGQDVHEHSLTAWQTAWEREHQQDDRFPAILVPLTTTP
jgi:hypothetical protein